MSTLTMTNQRFIIRAGLESKKSDLASKHGCVIVSNGKIIGCGHNSSRTYSRDGFINNTCSCHAEIAAIREVVSNQKENSFSKNFYDKRQCILSKKTLPKNNSLRGKNRCKWKLHEFSSL